jgi:hypothetical protein
MADIYPPVVDYFDRDTPTIKFEFLFQIKLELGESTRFEPTPPGGGRIFVPPAGGIVEGPRLNGKVMPYSGAEWAHTRSDNVNEINAHYMIQADDGTLIYLQNRGYHYSMDPSKPRPAFGDNVPYYFHPVPTFDCPVGPHDWLTRTVIIGSAKRFMEPSKHSVFQYFAVL